MFDGFAVGIGAAIGERARGRRSPDGGARLGFDQLDGGELLFFALGHGSIEPDEGSLAAFAIHLNPMALQERDFYDEKEQRKTHSLTCPHCRQAAEYEVNWLVRTKKKSVPGRADETDRARFAKWRSYMVRRDDMQACKNVRCRKRFEIAGVQSVAFLE